MHEDVVASICDMPATFHKRGDVSMVGLIAESGYVAVPDEITRDSIERHLRANPRLVPLWGKHSEDQRCTPAQYLELPEGIDTKPGRSIVGYIETNGNETERRRFDSPFAACAYFIKREAEILRSLVQEAS